MSKVLITSRPTNWCLGLLIVVATMLAYQPAWNGKPVWDDDAHLTKAELRSVDGLVRMWTDPGATQQYYPLTFSAFWVQHRLWGDSTPGYHLVNIVLHAFSALLLFGLLRSFNVPGAWLAAAIFALHPVHVESVAWMTELKNTLSGVLYLGALSAYLKFDRTRRQPLYAVAVILFLLGLAAKTTVSTLPAVILVVLWWDKGRLNVRRDVLPLVPFFLGGLAAGLLTVWLERKFFGAEGLVFNFSFVERCLIAGRSFWFHLGKLFWPANLMFMYPRWEISQAIWWQYLYPAGTALFLAVLWALRNRNRGPLAAVLCFSVTLFPALGFFNAYSFRYSFVNDHHQYLASLPMIVLFAAGVAALLSRWESRCRPLGIGFCLLLLSVLAVLTWRQSGMYSDMETLWRTTIERNPACSMAHNNLGQMLFQEGRVDEAMQNYRKAMELQPDNAEAFNNLGNALLQKGRVAEAVANIKKAMELVPNVAQFHSNLGTALAREGRFHEAITNYARALELKPGNLSLLNNMAWLLATCPDERIRDGEHAVELGRQAVQLSARTDPMIIGTLAAAYAEAGRFDEAVATGEQARALALAAGQTELAERNTQLLELYRARKPYREVDGSNTERPRMDRTSNDESKP